MQELKVEDVLPFAFPFGLGMPRFHSDFEICDTITFATVWIWQAMLDMVGQLNIFLQNVKDIYTYRTHKFGSVRIKSHTKTAQIVRRYTQKIDC